MSKIICNIIGIAVLVISSYVSAEQPLVEQGYYSSSVNVRSMQRDINDDLYLTQINYDSIYDNGEGVNWVPPWAYSLTGYWDITGQYWAPGEYWSFYLQDYSAMGILGPVGPAGPLSNRGPISTPSLAYMSEPGSKKIKNFFNLNNKNCRWCKKLWKRWYKPMVLDKGSRALPESDGPDGPLGEDGPLNPTAVYNTMYHLLETPYRAQNFPQNLDVVGTWGLLGPLSELGGFGAIGALGPNGLRILRGYTIDDNGSYIDSSSQIVRTFPMQYSHSGTYRVYRMHEFYDESYAMGLGEDNDASFGVQGTMSDSGDSKSFVFTSLHNQIISAVAVPNTINLASNDFMDLDLQVEKKVNGEFKTVLIADSTSSTSIPVNVANAEGYIDWGIFQANSGGVFRVTVTPKTYDAQNNVYRIFVTGTGFLEGPEGQEEDINVFNHQNITGPYQGNYCIDDPTLCQ